MRHSVYLIAESSAGQGEHSKHVPLPQPNMLLGHGPQFVSTSVVQFMMVSRPGPQVVHG